MSLTVSQIKPPVSAFLVDPASPYTVTGNPYDKYIYAADGAAGAFTFNLPLANTVYAGFSIRVVNQRTTAGNTITVAKQGSDTLIGQASIPVATATFTGVATYMSDGVSSWYAS